MSEHPAERRSAEIARYDFQRSAVTYVTTSAFLWVIWMISGSPAGLPGIAAHGSNVTATFGVFPAWAMLLGLPGLMRHAWEVYSPRPDGTGPAST